MACPHWRNSRTPSVGHDGYTAKPYAELGIISSFGTAEILAYEIVPTSLYVGGGKTGNRASRVNAPLAKIKG